MIVAQFKLLKAKDISILKADQPTSFLTTMGFYQIKTSRLFMITTKPKSLKRFSF